jgi:arylsulfatase A-like enzyme
MRKSLSVLLLFSISLFAQNEKPNFILIMADDLGYGDVGFTSNNTPGYMTPIQTPNLDTLAGESLELLNFYSIGPVCSPTRGSFLTGRHYARFGIFSANVGTFPAEEISLAKICKEKGYTTGHFGKWHVGTLNPNESSKVERALPKYFAPPWERSYDVSFVTESSVPTWNPIDPVTPYYENGVKADYNDSSIAEEFEGDDSKIMMDKIIPFIENAVDTDTPFLSVVWFHAPHTPIVAGPDYKALYSEYTEEEQNYYGCITAMDDQIGRLNSKLEELEIDDNTFIVFCSDNGPEKNKPGQTGGLRNRKRSLYNGGVIVPAFIKWPSKITSASESTFQTSVLDLFPTIADIIDYNLPDDRPIDGESILPFLNGETLTRNSSIPFLHKQKMAWINGDYKFRINFDGNPNEAYNMMTDRNELNNVISSFPSSEIENIKENALDWNCSVNWSYWGYDYLPNDFETADEEWLGLKNITCDDVPNNHLSAINKKSDNGFKTFPNPVEKNLNVRGKIKGGNFKILDLNGKTIRSGYINKNNSILDVSKYKSGSYLIEITKNKETFRKLFIKK